MVSDSDWRLFEQTAGQCRREVDGETFTRWQATVPTLRRFTGVTELLGHIGASPRPVDDHEALLSDLMNLARKEQLAGLVVLSALARYIVAKARWLAITMDVDEVISVFVEEIWSEIVVHEGEITSAGRLCERVRVRVRRLVRRDVDRRQSSMSAVSSAAPDLGFDDGDRVYLDDLVGEAGEMSSAEELTQHLQWAVRCGVITADMARLVVETRVEGVSVETIALANGVSAAAICKRRRVVERALQAA